MISLQAIEALFTPLRFAGALTGLIAPNKILGLRDKLLLSLELLEAALHPLGLELEVAVVGGRIVFQASESDFEGTLGHAIEEVAVV